jgi:hypothetical protein
VKRYRLVLGGSSRRVKRLQRKEGSLRKRRELEADRSSRKKKRGS